MRKNKGAYESDTKTVCVCVRMTTALPVQCAHIIAYVCVYDTVCTNLGMLHQWRRGRVPLHSSIPGNTGWDGNAVQHTCAHTRDNMAHWKHNPTKS